ncbi:nifU-like protein 1, chloroplastic [Phragmites australis]|uniref:nifU-like protein 1, chloroplastic n=1 Tax=Phragmites australis TaxID=29695 RepID=UPI002D79CB1F|nr:nifU-like protein 1, chloroplastic [Phragmites australis]
MEIDIEDSTQIMSLTAPALRTGFSDEGFYNNFTPPTNEPMIDLMNFDEELSSDDSSEEVGGGGGVASWSRGSSPSPAPRSVAAVPTRRRPQVVRAIADLDPLVQLPLTAENVELVLDEVRPYLMADGGDVALQEIDRNVVRLNLQGACGSCPSSVNTMKMGIERRLMEKIPEIVAVEPITNKETGFKLNAQNIQKVLFSFFENAQECCVSNMIGQKKKTVFTIMCKLSRDYYMILNHPATETHQ